MSSFFDKAIKEKRHYYPFLGRYGFRYGTDEFCPELLHYVVGMYLTRHLRKNAGKKDSSATEVLDSLVEQVAHSGGKDIFGMGSSLLTLAEKLSAGDEVELEVGVTKVRLLMRRFGTSIAIRATDARGDVHKEATEILEQMALLPSEKGGLDHLLPFVHSRTIVTPRWQAEGNKSKSIDICAERISAARYVPDVVWRTDSDVITDELVQDYIVMGHRSGCSGVQVGQYHDIPIFMRIIFGKDDSDQVWRKGCISREGSRVKFDADSNVDNHAVCYSVRMADEGDGFKKARSDIDYVTEQECQERLAQILLNAFAARDLEETIRANPPWVAWKKKETKPAKK